LARAVREVVDDPEGPPPVTSLDPGDDYLFALDSKGRAVLIAGDAISSGSTRTSRSCLLRTSAISSIRNERDQASARDCLEGSEHERREHRPLLPPAEPDDLPVSLDL